jgi:hypothetical protein
VPSGQNSSVGGRFRRSWQIVRRPIAGPRTSSRRPLLDLTVELKVLVVKPAAVAAFLIVPNAADDRRGQEPDAWRNSRIQVGEFRLQASRPEVNVLTDVLGHARPFILCLEPGSAVAPVPAGVPLPCNAFVAMPTHVLRVRTPARSRVAETLGALDAMFTLGGR